MEKPVVLITGALTGIGRATAIGFAKEESLDVRVSLTGALLHLKGHPEDVPNVSIRIDPCR